jgi:hypothetical protein
MPESDPAPPEVDHEGRVLGARQSRTERLRHRLGIGPTMPRRIYTDTWRRRLVQMLKPIGKLAQPARRTVQQHWPQPRSVAHVLDLGEVALLRVADGVRQ